MKRLAVVILGIGLLLVAPLCYATPTGVAYSDPMAYSRMKAGVSFDFSESKTALVPAATYNYIVDPSIDVFMKVGASGEGAIRFIIFEGPTYTGGTSETAYNQYRGDSSVATSIASLVSDPTTVSVTGTTIWSEVAGDGRAVKELILDDDTDYMLRVINVSTATQDITINGSFFRVLDRIQTN